METEQLVRGSDMPLVYEGKKVDKLFILGLDSGVKALQGVARVGKRSDVDGVILREALELIDYRNVDVVPTYTLIDRKYVKELMEDLQKKAVNAQKYFIDHLEEFKGKNVVLYNLGGKATIQDYVVQELIKVGVHIVGWDAFHKEPSVYTLYDDKGKLVFENYKNPIMKVVLKEDGDYVVDSFVETKGTEQEGVFYIEMGKTQFEVDSFYTNYTDVKGLGAREQQFLEETIKRRCK